MIQLPVGTKIWIAAGVTELRRGFDGLSAQVQNVLHEQPFSGHVFTASIRSSISALCSAASPSTHQLDRRVAALDPHIKSRRDYQGRLTDTDM